MLMGVQGRQYPHHAESLYITIMDQIMCEGKRKNTRAGHTMVLPPKVIQHDMQEYGFPLFQSKHMAKRTMLTELEGFLGGITDKRWYQERDCHVWDGWSNKCTRPRGVSQEDWWDLGPIYGYQWRRFGHNYHNDTVVGPADKKCPLAVRPSDQLATIIKTLKEDPDNRRLVCSSWNPVQHEEMALPPCHVLWNVQHINGVLHLAWHQRSCDWFLGVPFNIASYAMLLTLLAKECDMTPGTLTGTFVDTHLYDNQYVNTKEHGMSVAHQQLAHWGEIDAAVISCPVEVDFKEWNGLFEWEATNTVFVNHEQGPKLKVPVKV